MGEVNPIQPLIPIRLARFGTVEEAGGGADMPVTGMPPAYRILAISHAIALRHDFLAPVVDQVRGPAAKTGNRYA
jgi:hypothetical protein